MDSKRLEEATKAYFLTKMQRSQRAIHVLREVTTKVYGGEGGSDAWQACSVGKLQKCEERLKSLQLEFEESHRAEEKLKACYELYCKTASDKGKLQSGNASNSCAGNSRTSVSQESTSGEGENPVNGGKNNGLKANKCSTMRSVPDIPPISEDEFAGIPSYMKGRITIAQINTIITKLNAVVDKKYRMLSAGIRGATSRADKDEYYKYKDEQTKLTGARFCSEDDLRAVLAVAEASCLKKVIPILRHFKRIRDTRCGKETFLVVQQ